METKFQNVEFRELLQDDVEAVKLLLERFGPNVVDSWGHTPLHYVAWRGHVDAIKLLLENGADPNVRDVNGWTPLHYAAKYCRLEEAILLLDWGADPNARDDSGKTPLHYAVEQYRRDNDCLRIVELLSQ